MADQKFKSKVKLQGGVNLPAQTASRAPVIDGSGDLVSSSVTSTELGHLSGVTSPIQTQITAAQGDATQALADAAAAQADATQALSDAAAAQTSINNHLSDTTDAHDASAISSVPSGNLAATDVQGALNELQSDVDSRIPSSEKGANNGVATLDAGGKVPVSQLPSSVMTYEGVWNASTNSPSLADGVGDAGMVYRVGTAGSQNLGSGSISFEVGDYVIYNGSIWEKSDTTDAVASVNGQTGIVSLDSDDITEGATNLYFTDERAQDAIGAMIADSDTIDLTYTDGTPELKADVKTQMSITSDASGIKLSGDAATPGNSKYYGTDGSGVKGFHALPNVGASAGDLVETSFSLANNQASAANVTGLSFSTAVVRSFKALVSVEIDATADLFEAFELVGINKGGSFEMSVSAVGDESGVTLSITAGGQVQYTSANYAGFVSGAIKFRAQTLTL